MASRPSTTIAGSLELTIGERDARVGGECVGIRSGWRHRAQELPAAGSAVRAVFHEQRVQDRGAGARRAGDEQRLADLLVAHAGVGAHVRRHLKAHLEDAQEEAPGDPAAEQRELRFLFERGHEHVERLEEVVVAEVGDAAVRTRRDHADPGTGLTEQAVTREGQRRFLRDREHVAAVHRHHPIGARFRSASHGENVRQAADGNSVPAHDREPDG